MLGDSNPSSSAIPITDVDCKGNDLDKLFRRHFDILLQRLDERLAQHQQEIKDMISHRTLRTPLPPAPTVPHSGCNLSPRGLLSISPRGLMENAAIAASLCETSRSPRRYCDKVHVGSRPPSRGHPQREASTPPRPPRGESNADAVISFSLPGGTMETELTAHTSHAPHLSPRTVPPGSPPTLEDSLVEETAAPPFSKEALRHRSAIGIQRRFSQDMWRQKIRHKLSIKGMPDVKHRVFKPADFLTAHSKQEAVAKQSVLAGIVFTDCFDLVSSFLIVANCIFIAVQLEWVTAQAEIHGHEVVPAWSQPLELFFCIVFGIEFMLRCFAHGRGIFHAKDWQWTVFDGSVVLVSVVELALDLLADAERVGNTSFFRSMRALRTTRAVRVVRVFRFFKELRMLILSILGSFKTLVWSAVMMVLFWYVCGVTLTTATYEVCSISPDAAHEDCPALKDRFGTLRRAVLALYMSMAGGVDWAEIYNVMNPMSEVYRALFLVYLFFTMFGVLNIVTGIFVETAKEAGSADRDGLVRAQMRHQDRYMSDMIRLFEEIDSNGSGRISREEFHWYLADERALAYFEALKLDISDVSTLFDLLDSNGSGGIDIEEFLSGCQRLRGESRALDLAVLRTEMLSWMGHFSIFAEKVEKQLDILTRKPGRPHTTGGCGERRAWTSSTVGP
mmetsp:Transcript_126048/g.368324  ORF Transcript_126048/g.368324 Transcript_126048/m.368324 type:complete len:675 (-) Transcript_126048:151-2175(-)